MQQDSNTTLVKVKLNKWSLAEIFVKNSNTTLVKVKYKKFLLLI